MGKFSRLTRQLDTAFNRPSAASLRQLRSGENDSEEEIAQEYHHLAHQSAASQPVASHNRGMLSPQLPKRDPPPQKPHPSPNPLSQKRGVSAVAEPSDRKLLSVTVSKRGAAPLPPAGGKHLKSPNPEKNPTPLPPAALDKGLHFPSIQDRAAAPLPPKTSSSQPPLDDQTPPSSPSSLAPRLATHQAMATPTTRREPTPLPPAALRANSPPSFAHSSPQEAYPPSLNPHGAMPTPTTHRQPTPLPPAALHQDKGQLSPPSPTLNHIATPYTHNEPTPLPRAALSNSPSQQLSLPPSSPQAEGQLLQPRAPSQHPLPTPNNRAQPTPLPPAALHQQEVLTLPPSPSNQHHLATPNIQRQLTPLPSAAFNNSQGDHLVQPAAPSQHHLPTPNNNAQPTPLPPAAIHSQQVTLTLPPSPTRQHLPTPTTRRQPTPLPPAAINTQNSQEELLVQPPAPSQHPLPTPNNQAQPTPLPPAAIHSEQPTLALPPSPTHGSLPTPKHRDPTPLPPAALYLPTTPEEPMPPAPSQHHLPTPHNQAQPTPLPPAALHSQQVSLALPPSPSNQHHLATPNIQRQLTPLPSAALSTQGDLVQPRAPSQHPLPTPNNQAQPTPLPPAALHQQEVLALPPSPSNQHHLATPNIQRQLTPLPSAAFNNSQGGHLVQPAAPSQHHLPTPNNQAQPTPLPPAALHQQEVLTLPPSPSNQHHLATPNIQRQLTPLPSAAFNNSQGGHLVQPAAPSQHHLPTPHNQAQPTPLPPAALHSQQVSLALPPSPSNQHHLATPNIQRQLTPLPSAALSTQGDLVQPRAPSQHPLPTPNNQAQPTPLPPAALSNAPQLSLPPSPTHKHIPTPDRGPATPLPPAALASPQQLGQPPRLSHNPLPTPNNQAQPTPLPAAALNSQQEQLTLPPSPTYKHLQTPDMGAQPTPLPPSYMRSPHFPRGGALNLVTRTPPLTSNSGTPIYPSKNEEEEDISSLKVANSSLASLTLRAPTPVRDDSDSDSESEGDDEDFTLPFKRYDNSDPQKRLEEQKKVEQIKAPVGRRLVNPPIMGMAPHPMYHHAPQAQEDLEDQRRKRAQYVTGRVGGGVGAAMPSLLAQENRVAIVVEGEKNALVHFDMGQAFAWEFLRKKQRITKDDYEMALKIQAEEEERIAKELEKRKEESHEREMSDAEFARQLAEERALQQSMRQSRVAEQQLRFSNLTNSLLVDLEQGGFDMGQLDLPMVEPEPAPQGREPKMTSSMAKRPLEMSTADLTQSMMTDKWKTLTDLRLAKNENERENIQNLLDLEIATKMQQGMALSEIFMSMNSKNKMWGMVENLRCFHSMSLGERDFGPIREGNRIYLPTSITKYLDFEPHEQVNVEIVNPFLPNRQKYAAVAEFVDVVGIAIVPPSLMEDLKLDEGGVAQFCRIEVPNATKVTFKAETHFEYDMNNITNATSSFRSFEKGAKLTIRDNFGEEQVLTCTAVAPESPAALGGGMTTFEVEMPAAGHQIPFTKLEVDGMGTEGWVEEEETIYFAFNLDGAMANKRIVVSLDAKFGDPDMYVCVETGGNERIAPQNLGPNKYHWSSSQAEKGKVVIETGDPLRRLGSKFYIAVRGFLFSAAFIVRVKSENVGGHAGHAGNAGNVMACDNCHSDVRMSQLGQHPCFNGEGDLQAAPSPPRFMESELVLEPLSCPYCEAGGIMGNGALQAHMVVCEKAQQFGASF